MKPAIVLAALAAAALGCGKPAAAPAHTTAADAVPPHHRCGKHDHVQHYDLHDEDGQDHFAPCAETGHQDFSGLVRLETTPEGVHIMIRATDDDVNEGKLGEDLKGRDAMIVYPKGRGEKGVEIPLQHTAHGYQGDRVIPFADLEKLTDEGTKVEVSIFDHDDAHTDGKHEELKVSITISAGKSCEKAMDENPQEITMGKNAGPDLSNAALGAPMQDASFISKCNLPDSANADICVAVKNGKPLGVSVSTTPMDKKVAACIDRATRKLAFPASPKLDVVKEHF